MNDKPKEYCGIFGVYENKDAALLTYYGLHALQHRGQEAAGIITQWSDEQNISHFNRYKGEGLVSEVFQDFDDWKNILKGRTAIGHNRYSTTGASKSRKNIQPFKVHYRLGNLAIAHNGNLTNAAELRKELVKEGALFQTTSDTEVVLHLVARSKLDNQVDQIVEALNTIEGAFCVVIMTDDKLIAARDPHGFRPLAMGKKDGSFMFASESCAFDINKAEYIREVEPGEVIIIDNDVIETGNIKTRFLNNIPEKRKQCIFEFIYFSRPDSRIFNTNVDKVRRRLGKILADRYPVYPDNDDDPVIVISVPDSSNTAALGYARRLMNNGIPAKFELGLIRSHYIGRTFIEPGQNKREMSVRIKFNPVKGLLENKKVVIVDDSIVRGTTSKLLVKLLQEAQPKEIHMRVSSPPILYPCYYGMDFPSKDELIATRMDGNIERIREHIGLDSLNYLTIEDLLDSVYDDDPEFFCTSCFSGNYPTAIDLTFKKEMYEI
jgi:amidophosphoribosyltransferase